MKGLSQRVQSNLILLLTALIWGTAFIAQRTGASHLGVFFFNGSRYLIGGLLLLPLARFHLPLDRKSLGWMALAGFLLFGGSALQQLGLVTTTAGKAGFLTGTYVVLIPVILAVFWKQQFGWRLWLAAGMTLAGIYLLSGTGSLQIVMGDIFELLGAVVWALHVIVVGRAMKQVDALRFSIGQFLFASVLNFICAGIFQNNNLAGFTQAWWQILYLGVFSTAIAFTLQAVGQRHAPAADAAIILSMETVFAALAGYLLLGEDLAPTQLIGCGLILAAILLSQLWQDNPTPLAAESVAGQSSESA